MTNPPITIVTPVHNRAKTWPFCEHWCQRAIANYAGSVQWIISDDGTEPVTPTLGQIHLKHKQFEPHNKALSINRNVKEALCFVDTEYVFFWEDDDWHSADYLTRYMELFDANPNANLIGEGNAIYYHVHEARYFIHSNMRHASLCQTAIRWPEMLPILRTESNNPINGYLDLRVWAACPANNRFVKANSDYTVGLKGLTPPNDGIGCGHSSDWQNYMLDSDFQVLKSKCGEDDAAYILEFAKQFREEK